MTYRNIVTLMRVPPPTRDLGWLQEALINAVQLELATLPPYLCAYWSIKNASAIAAKLIHNIYMQEMKHMGLAANMAVGVGATPAIDTEVPTYPGHLPGGVRPELTVYLAGLTKPYVKNVCMEIEMPENPLAKAVFGAEEFPTIGAFYDAIIDAFQTLQPAISQTNQITSGIGVTIIKSVTDAVAALNIIKVEGEGTQDSPDEAPDDPAHYYKFGSIFYGKTIVKQNGAWVWEGSDVPFPDAWPMAQVPAGGWAAQAGTPASVKSLLTEFDTTFKSLLKNLQGAWTGLGTFGAAVGDMYSLEDPAVQLMQIPVGGGVQGNYGPDFFVS